MLKFTTTIFLIVILSGCKCSKDENFIENKRAEIEKIGEFIIEETDSNLIGRIKLFQVNLKEKTILIGDPIFLELKTYNNAGKFIKKIGKKGEGPGEFKSIEGIAEDLNHYYISDYLCLRISIFTKDGLFQRSIKVPSEITFDTGELIVRNNKIYMNSFETKYKVFYENYLSKIITVLDTGGNILYNYGNYPDIYKKYQLMWTSPKFDIDEEGSTYISTFKSWQLSKYDSKGNLIKFFGIKGNNFREEKESYRGDETYAEIKKRTVQASHLPIMKYGNNYVYQQYSNTNDNFIKSKSKINQEHYLMVYTKDGEYIKSDIKLPGGGMLDVDDDGIIYIELSDEPGNRIIGKYKINIIDEN